MPPFEISPVAVAAAEITVQLAQSGSSSDVASRVSNLAGIVDRSLADYLSVSLANVRGASSLIVPRTSRIDLLRMHIQEGGESPSPIVAAPSIIQTDLGIRVEVKLYLYDQAIKQLIVSNTGNEDEYVVGIIVGAEDDFGALDSRMRELADRVAALVVSIQATGASYPTPTELDVKATAVDKEPVNNSSEVGLGFGIGARRLPPTLRVWCLVALDQSDEIARLMAQSLTVKMPFYLDRESRKIYSFADIQGLGPKELFGTCREQAKSTASSVASQSTQVDPLSLTLSGFIRRSRPDEVQIEFFIEGGGLPHAVPLDPLTSQIPPTASDLEVLSRDLLQKIRAFFAGGPGSGG